MTPEALPEHVERRTNGRYRAIVASGNRKLWGPCRRTPRDAAADVPLLLEELARRPDRGGRMALSKPKTEGRSAPAPEVLTEREVAALLRLEPREARAVLERDGLRIVAVSASRWRVDREAFDRWYRCGAPAPAPAPQDRRLPGTGDLRRP